MEDGLWHIVDASQSIKEIERECFKIVEQTHKKVEGTSVGVLDW